MKPFTENDKFDWPKLDENSLVVDVGFYKGAWSREMVNRYNCKVWAFEPYFANDFEPCGNITLFRHALAEKQEWRKFAIHGEMTGEWAEGDQTEFLTMPVSTLYSWSRISVLSLNCEGGEFEILETIIKDGKLPMFENLVIQFHSVVPDATNRMLAIRDELNKTHECVCCESWCWEIWTIKKHV